MKTILILISLLFSYISYANIKVIQQDTVTQYYIDTVKVTKEAFENKMAKMEETGGWFCWETNTGGTTGYTCKDELGQEYKYTCITEPDKNEYRLSKMNVNPPKSIKNIIINN